MSNGYIVRPCPKCRAELPMTRHHIYPKRHFGGGGGKDIFLLCRDCHDELERWIPQHQVMPREFYPAIIYAFTNQKEK
jgi:5-methylcytosine-specific restriction endonuclease McrA